MGRNVVSVKKDHSISEDTYMTNSKPIIATILVLLALSVTLAGPNTPVPVGYQVVGDQLIVTLANSGPFNATVSVTAVQDGEILGTVIVTVPAQSTADGAIGINDDLNPFDIGVSVGAVAQN